jgi:hypothetical protein
VKELSKKVDMETHQSENLENEVLGCVIQLLGFRHLQAERSQGEDALLTFKLPSASWQVCRALVSGETRICTQTEPKSQE